MPQPLSSMPQDYLKLLPRINRAVDISAQRHIEIFCAFVENLNVKNLGVVSNLLTGNLGSGLNPYQMLPFPLGRRWRTPLCRSGESKEIMGTFSLSSIP